VASEALEQSLRAEIEKHFNSSLNELRGEVTRLQNLLHEAVKQHQSETNSAIAKLMESVSGENEAIVAAITEQLRSAREGAAEQALYTTPARSNDALIRNAIVDLCKQKSQVEILKTLVSYSASLAPRVAFFIVKDGHTKGWRARGFESSVGNESIAEITLPLTAQTPLSEVIKTQTAWDGELGNMPDDYKLLGSLGTITPRRAVTVPLVARGRSVAVLYADSGHEDTNSINLDALESLVRVAGMSVELLAARVASSASPAAQAAASPGQEAQASGPAVAPEMQPEPTPPVQEEQPAEEPQMEAAPAQQEWAQSEPTPSWEEVSYQPQPQQPVTEPVEEEIPYTQPPAHEESTVEFGYTTTPMTMPTPEPSYSQVETYAPVEPTPERPTYSQATPTQTAPATSASASSAAARSYGRKDIDLPIEVGEEERRYHNEARRFARLLVSEIKLYNEPRVKEGREARDLYDRLREAIDRSREMYDKRVHHLVAMRFDYFHFELVNTLAEGDEDKLGNSYPGPSV
jgi:hypothetical protein